MFLYHGTKRKFDKFSLDYVGETGTSEGFGIYLTNSLDIASNYAQPYIMAVEVKLENHISKETKMNLVQYRMLVETLQQHTDLLSNYGEVAYEGYAVVLERALDTYNYCDNDIDLISELANSIGSKELVNRAMYNLFHVTHIIDDDPEWGKRRDVNHIIYVVLLPEFTRIVDIKDKKLLTKG